MAFFHRRAFFCVNVLIAVHDIVLQQFQVCQIIFRMAALLMIVEYCSGMDIQSFKHICHHLICRYVSVLFL